jgi:hypothetical protein
MQVSILEGVSKLEQTIQEQGCRLTQSTPPGGEDVTQGHDECCSIGTCNEYDCVCNQCKRVLDPKEL